MFTRIGTGWLNIARGEPGSGSILDTRLVLDQKSASGNSMHGIDTSSKQVSRWRLTPHFTARSPLQGSISTGRTTLFFRNAGSFNQQTSPGLRPDPTEPEVCPCSK